MAKRKIHSGAAALPPAAEWMDAVAASLLGFVAENDGKWRRVYTELLAVAARAR